MKKKFAKQLKLLSSKIALVLVIALLLIGLSTFNTVVSIAETALVKVDEMPDNVSTVYKSISFNSQTNDDIMENISIDGWSFCETDEDNAERYVTLYLKQRDGEVIYEVSCELKSRADVQATFPYLSNKSVNLGFSANFSTINIENGIYEVYLFCHENDVNYGLINTDYIIEKQGQNVTIAKDSSVFVPVLTEEITVEVTNIAHSCIPHIDISENSIIFLTGWAFCETEENNNNKTIQILFRSESMDYLVATNRENRVDVYTAFMNSLSIQGCNHGYKCECDLSSLPAGDYELLVLCHESENASGLTALNRIVHVTADGITVENLNK